MVGRSRSPFWEEEQVPPGGEEQVSPGEAGAQYWDGFGLSAQLCITCVMASAGVASLSVWRMSWPQDQKIGSSLAVAFCTCFCTRDSLASDTGTI